jgi:putative membrane protein
MLRRGWSTRTFRLKPELRTETIQVASKAKVGAANLPDATELALERTNLAYERTLMAWVRTAVSLISFGFAIYKFFQYMREHQLGPPVRRLFGPREFALLMIAIGVVLLLLATLQNWQLRKGLKKRYHEAPFSLATMIAALISLLGILALVAVICQQ